MRTSEMFTRNRFVDRKSNKSENFSYGIVITLLIFFFGGIALAQTGGIKGTVIDKSPLKSVEAPDTWLPVA